MSTKGRVLIVSAKLDVGGTENHLLQILPRLASRGLYVQLFVLKGGGTLTENFKTAGIDVIEPRPDRKGLPGLVFACTLLFRLLSRQRFDVVHFFLPAPYVIGATITMLVSKAKLAMSRRSLNHYQRRHPGIRLVEKLLHRKMEVICGNSKAVCQQLLEEGVPHSRLSLIHNGVELIDHQALADAPSRCKLYNFPVGSIVFVCVANLFRYKGHSSVLEAFSIAKPSLPENWRLVCVGRDAGEGHSLKSQANALGLSEKIIWLGELPSTSEILKCADVAVQCSLEEGFSNAILEEMAAGLPIIATNVGGNPDAVLHGQNGFLVEAGDSRGIARALVELSRSPSLIRQMGMLSRSMAREKFSIEKCVDSYWSLYSRLLKTCA